MACQRYIELNPMRAGMVAHPAEYRWASYRANAQGEADNLLRPHPLYDALGDGATTRQVAYRELLRHELDPGMVDQIRSATNGNFALGNEPVYVTGVGSARQARNATTFRATAQVGRIGVRRAVLNRNPG